MTDPRKPVFAAIKAARDGKAWTVGEIERTDAFLDSFGIERMTEFPDQRTVSAAGESLVKRWEGLRLKAYPDPGTGGEPWTIGFGRAHGVKRGDTITEAQAERFLREDLATAAAQVAKMAPETTQGQFDALTSFVFNLGAARLASSTLLKRHNDGKFDAAANEFVRWIFAAGKAMPGLVMRRADEVRLYRGLA